jgi:hypothetical protein
MKKSMIIHSCEPVVMKGESELSLCMMERPVRDAASLVTMSKKERYVHGVFRGFFLSSFSGCSCIRFRRLDVVLAAARLAPAARAAWAVIIVVRTATAAAGTTAATG